MITEARFDPVFDCQQVFKALMNALARPGVVASIRPSIEKLPAEHAPLVASGLTLLDNWRKFAVFGCDALARQLRELTYGVPAPLEEADYIFIPLSCSGAFREVLSRAKPGTLPEPHKSATVFIMLERLTGGQPAWLRGPGVDGSLEISLPEEGQAWLRARQEMAFEFPCGIDLIFLTPQGDVLGAPRKITMGGNDEWVMSR